MWRMVAATMNLLLNVQFANQHMWCTLQSLHGDLDKREHQLANLRASATPLVELCSRDVAEQIGTQVERTERQWNETAAQLTQLCEKYQRAVQLWNKYKQASESLSEFVEEKIINLDTMDPNETLKYIEDYTRNVPIYKKKLEDIQRMVDGIAAEIELDSTNLLTMEVDVLTKKLDHIQLAITKLADFAEEKANRLASLESDIQASSHVLDDVQRVSRRGELLTGMFNNSTLTLQQLKVPPPTVEKTPEHLLAVREHLLKLGRTQNQLQKCQKAARDDPEISVIEVLTIWQQLFKETFLQYYRLSSSMMKTEDITAVLKLWDDYLKHIEGFLATPIPPNFSGLADDKHICEVHQNLLNNQMDVFEKNVRAEMAERFAHLINRHHAIQQQLQDRHAEIQRRTEYWERYNSHQDELLDWIKRIEQNRSSIQLYYLNLKRVPMIRGKIEEILNQIPKGEAKSAQLKEAEKQILVCSDDTVRTSLKISHAAMDQRIQNLKAGLQTWLDFIRRVTDLQRAYDGQVKAVQDKLAECQQIYSTTCQKNLAAEPNFDRVLEPLEQRQREIVAVRGDIEQIMELLEQLKERVSPHDLKSMRQIVCLLGHQRDDLEQQYSSLINDWRSKMSLYGLFNERYAYLTTWMEGLERRIHGFTAEMSYMTYDADDVQRYIESEINTETALKERDRDWLVGSGKQLLTLFSEANRTEEVCDIQFKLNDTLGRWDQLKSLCKSRGTELADMKVTIVKLELRIAELRAWLAKMEKEFARPLHFADLTERSYKTQLTEVARLQKEIENESMNFSEVLNLCEMLFSDVNIWKRHFNMGALSVAMDNIERRWKHLCHLSTDRKRQVMSLWAMFQDVQKGHKEAEPWLEARVKALEAMQPPREFTRNTVAEYLGKLNAEAHELRSKEALRVHLEKSYRQLFIVEVLEATNMVNLFQHVKELLLRWSSTIEWVVERENAEGLIFSNFLDLHEDAVMRLAQIDAAWTEVEITQLHETVRQRKVTDVTAQLSAAEELVRAADEAGGKAQECYKEKGVIQELMDEYRKMFEDIKRRVEMAGENREEVNEANMSVQVNTLTEFTKKDAYLLELKGALKETEANLAALEKELQDEKRSFSKPSKTIGACESSVELIEHLRMVIQKECQGSEEECQTVEVERLTKRFALLMGMWKAKEKSEIAKK